MGLTGGMGSGQLLCSAGVFILNVKSYFNATWFLVLAMLYDARQHTHQFGLLTSRYSR